MSSGARSHVPLPPSPGEQPSLTSRRAGWGFSQHTCFQDVEAEFPTVSGDQWAVPPVPTAGQPGPRGRASSSGGGGGARSPQGLLCCPGAGWHPGSSASEAFLEVWQ